jgi:hypothetical protein
MAKVVTTDRFGDTHPLTVESFNNLIDLYEAWNTRGEAENAVREVKWEIPGQNRKRVRAWIDERF